MLNSLDEVDPEVRSDVRQARHSARGAEAARRRRRRRGVRQRLGRDDVPGEAGRAGHHLLSFSEAVQHHPDLVKKYLGSVVPYTDNFFATLNSAVFSDGSFVYIPKGVRCPMELSTYFRINAKDTGQFERTLIIADEGAYVSYLEGCTAPMRDENQLHAAVVELVAHRRCDDQVLDDPELVSGRQGRQGRHLQLRHQARACAPAASSKITWTQVETGSAITWKYPSCILQGDNSIGEFYSVATTNNWQQADTGTKMIHLGQEHPQHDRLEGHLGRPRAEHLSRRWCKIGKNATNARNYSQCDSLLIGDKCGAHTFPYLEIRNTSAQVEHEASTSKIGEDQIFYCRQRGICDRGRRQHDRQRLLQGSVPRAADGVRRRSAEAAQRQPGRIGRLATNHPGCGSEPSDERVRARWAPHRK